MRKHRGMIPALILALCLLLAACASQPAATESAPAESRTETEKETASAPAEETSSDPEETADPSTEESAQEEDTEEEPAAEHKEVLVVYFSATGTTKGVAEKIAKITDADLYEIVPAEPYSEADLNWNDSKSRSTKEQNDKSARPAIGSADLDLSGYTTIYVGFPIWWGEEPRILDTFVESYDFTGITLIPFCTSGGSGIGRSGTNMEELAGSGTWLKGARHSGSISEADLESWIDGLK